MKTAYASLLVSVLLSAALSWCSHAAERGALPAEPPKVLLLGDEVMFAYQKQVAELLNGKADCTFVRMPTSAPPDWRGLSKEHLEGKDWDFIHFSYGRELMRHGTDGKPAVPDGETWGIYIDLIKTLGRSGAFLIGCTTTPVRGQPSRESGPAVISSRAQQPSSSRWVPVGRQHCLCTII